MENDELTESIIGAAIEVHRVLGPGLLEAAYEGCLAFELDARGIRSRRQVLLPVQYKGHRVEQAYRIDLLVGGRVVVELKAVESVLPVHRAQILTYLRLTGLKVGLILNFHVPVLRDGIVRVVLTGASDSSASQRLSGDPLPQASPPPMMGP